MVNTDCLEAFEAGETTLWFLHGEPVMPILPRFVCRKIAEDRLAILAWNNSGALEKWRAMNPAILSEAAEMNINEVRANIERSGVPKGIKYSIELLEA